MIHFSTTKIRQEIATKQGQTTKIYMYFFETNKNIYTKILNTPCQHLHWASSTTNFTKHLQISPGQTDNGDK